MKIAKTLLLIGTGLLLMGNQSCEKQDGGPAVKPRKLKRIIDVGVVKSQLIDLPNGEKFDFQYVINQQIYPVLSKSDGFFFRYKQPFDEMPNQIRPNIELSSMNFPEGDLKALQAEMGKAIQVHRSDDISCLVNIPQYRIRGMVSSFELISKFGLNLGFNSGGSTTSPGIGLGFDAENYQLDMNMVASHPWTEGITAATNVTAKQTRTRVEFSFPLSNLLIDPSFYFQTPLAKVSYNALENSVNQIKAILDSKEADKKIEWNTRVLLADEHAAMILAGRAHNVEEGDIFEVYDSKTIWISENGEFPVPCSSKFVDEEESDLPIATIKIVKVHDEMSRGTIIQESGIPIRMGAKVKLKQLAAPVVAAAIK